MQKALPQLKHSQGFAGASEVLAGNTVGTDKFSRLVEDWLADCQIRQHSPRTVELRRMLAGRLKWFLEERGFSQCGRGEIRQFFAYLAGGHQDSGG